MYKIKIALLVTLLFSLCLAQRGGGSRSSSSRSRSSGSRRSFWGSSRSSYNSTSSGQAGQSSSRFPWAVGGTVVIGVLAYIGQQQQKKKSKLRLQKIQRIFSDFQGSMQSNPCSLNPQQMESLKNWFMSQKWKITFYIGSGGYQYAQVIIQQIKNKSKYSYDIKMSMKDSIGRSKAKGILVHTGSYFSIKFEKTYQNRTQAGQTGLYDLLLYTGAQQSADTFKGQWAYQGFETDSRYSGTWTMTHE